eukprot:TRINITY_DN3546_c0_g1_i4.p1 TRINITY_DN3546_c0_g1~~TRINITY_DN3546_c0_g1_i4.p1  ORF type:complete len:247 (-),score=57.76 TRINITY_DN3546_c0_g1_i4:84-824(-)
MRKTKPSYFRMIAEAIRNLQYGPRSTVSVPAISKYIRNRFPVNPAIFGSYLRRALRQGTKEKKLIQIRRSFRLSSSAVKNMKRPAKRSAKAPRIASIKPRVALKKKRVTIAAASASDGNEVPAAPKPASSRAAKPVLKKKQARAPSKSDTGSKQPKVASVSGSKHPYVWQYLENDHTWQNYDTAASDLVEEIFLKYLGNKGDTDVRAVKSGQWEYMVDFIALKQTNIQHENHRIRNIRRVPNKAHN